MKWLYWKFGNIFESDPHLLPVGLGGAHTNMYLWDTSMRFWLSIIAGKLLEICSANHESERETTSIPDIWHTSVWDNSQSFFLFPSTFHAVTSQRVSAGHPRLASKFAFPAPSLRHHGFISGDFGIGQIYICPLTSTSTEAAAAAALA